ncbi:MAG: DM13 domain-containing protein [Pseudomonadota bacterium]|nr:DM13 domain-containing protein [Pseudomonadota bacterium]
MKLTQAALAAIAISLTGITLAAPVQAQSTIAQQAAYSTSGEFVRKSKKLKGSWSVVERDGKSFIVFADDFRAANGPDLKIFLSPKSVADATGKNAVDGSLNIGELKKTKGTQEYEVPAGVDLSQYGSVLVHCEAYSVLWGGGDL